jgi:hypothetical protein
MKFLTPAEFRIYLRHAAVAAIRFGLVALFLSNEILYRFIMQWRAKRALLHKYEFEAELTEWNAELSLDRARENENS